jgi:hypothetical protein
MLAYGPVSGVEKPVPANYVELSRRVAGYSALTQHHIHCAPEAHVSTWDMGSAEGLGSDSAAGGVLRGMSSRHWFCCTCLPCTTGALHVPVRLARALGQPARGPVQPPACGATDHAPSAADRVPGARLSAPLFPGEYAPRAGHGSVVVHRGALHLASVAYSAVACSLHATVWRGITLLRQAPGHDASPPTDARRATGRRSAAD